MPEDGLYGYETLLVVMLVGEKRLALAHLYLGSLYARLDQCSCYIFKSVGQYDVVSYVDASFLQMFLWETFRALSLQAS